jgi:hypothetical protein
MNGRTSKPSPPGLRWTIGDVSDRGFEALRLSIWGAWHVFGPHAMYVICVNSVDVREARERTGLVPSAVRWREVTLDDAPPFLRTLLARGMAQGTGWKFAPLRVFEERCELALDNDAILWSLPPSIERWLVDGASQGECLLAEDVRPCHGQFDELVPQGRSLNSGIRGLPPGFDFGAALRTIVALREQELNAPLIFASELDEQGLQAVALSRGARLHAVTVDEVTICSPFHPHIPHLGRCGAHFVGLNGRHIAWNYYDRPADEWMTEHWQRHRAELYARTGAPLALHEASSV